jgi:PKD repeat protein
MNISDYFYEQRGNFYIIGLLLLALLLVQPVLAFSGSGAGTVGDPYQITSTTQWNEMNSAKASYYKLMNNIDWGNTTPDEIGTVAAPFEGVLDGDFRTISNIVVPHGHDTYDRAGLFMTYGKAFTIKNLFIVHAVMDTALPDYNYIAIISGVNTEGTFENVHIDSTSSIGGTGNGYYLGSFSGFSQNGQTYSYCTSAVSITKALQSSGKHGGFVGYAPTATTTMTQCIFTGTISTFNAPMGQGAITPTNSYYDDVVLTPNTAVTGTGVSTSNLKTSGYLTGFTYDSTHWKMSKTDGIFRGYPIWFAWRGDDVTPVASFTVNATSLIVGQATIAVTDTTTNTPTSWAWSWGDGTANATTQNPTHTYSTPASPTTYTITLTATNGGGSSSVTNTTTFYIAPVADFTVDNTQVDCGLPVAFAGTPFHFTDLSTNTPTSWNWSYGDGNYGTVKNGTHGYSVVGTYDVSLTATNAGGSDTETKTFYVNVVEPITGMTFTPSAPVAISTGDSVAFSGSMNGFQGAFLWVFGDGYTSNVTLTPSHQYNTAGTYDVSFGRRDGQNIWNYVNKTALVVASGVVTPNFTFTPATGTAPLSVAFTDTSSGGTFLSATWNFGDGSTSTTRNPAHVFSAAGTKSVSLLWENTAHDTGYIVKTLTITSAVAPTANFSATPLTGAAPQTVTFTDLSTQSPTGWSWSFGDGSSSVLQNPTHTYTAGGNYTVILTTSNPGGVGSVSKNNYVQLTNPFNNGGVLPNTTINIHGTAPAITLDFGTKTTLNAWPVGVDTVLGEHVLVGTNTTDVDTVTVGSNTYGVDSWTMAYYRQIPSAPGTYSPAQIYSVTDDGLDSGSFLVDTPETLYSQTTAEYGNAMYMFRLFAINASYAPSGGEYDYGLTHILAAQENMTVGFLPPVASWSGNWNGASPKVGDTITFNYNLESLTGLSAQTDYYIYFEYSEDGGTIYYATPGYPVSIAGSGSVTLATSKAEILRGYVFGENLFAKVYSQPAVITIGATGTDPTFVWKNSGGTTITSASDTSTVYFGINTGATSWQNKPAWSTLALYFQKYNPNTGLWDTLPASVSGYTESAVPGYTMNVDTSNSHIWGKRTIAGFGSFIPMDWSGAGTVTVPEGKYRGVMMANGATGTLIKMSPELTVTKNMVNPSNVAGAAGGFLGLPATGGDAGIFFGFLLMVIFALVIFYIAKFNAYGLLGGAAIGFLISWALGLFPIWMVYILMVICIGLVAVVFLLGRGGGGDSAVEA